LCVPILIDIEAIFAVIIKKFQGPVFLKHSVYALQIFIMHIKKLTSSQLSVLHDLKN